jgi:hypothetical protein
VLPLWNGGFDAGATTDTHVGIRATLLCRSRLRLR